MIIDTYLFQECIDLTLVDGTISCKKVNYAMNNKIIKLHKGSDNDIQFRVRNTDLKPVDVSDITVVCKFYDVTTREKVLEKYALATSKCGWLQVKILEGDLVNLASGFYKMVLLKEDTTEFENVDYYSLSNFYSDTARNIDFDVEITDQAMVTPQPSVVIPFDKFTVHNEGFRQLAYYTSAIPCNAVRNHLNSVHTFALYLKNFTGTVEILGSLDIQPPVDLREYFTVKVSPYEDKLEFNRACGTLAYSFECNLTWVRFRIIPASNDPISDSGQVTQIVWRS